MCGNPNTRLLSRLIIDFLLLLAVYCVALVVLPQLLHTFERGFHCSDASLHYPYRQPWLTKIHLTILVIALPAAFVLVVEMLRAAFVPTGLEVKQRFIFVGARIPSFISECYKIIGLYLFGLGLTILVIRVTKTATGRLRPYFLDVCQPTWGEANAETCALQPPGNASSYIEHYDCTEFVASAELLALVRHSFPSGFVSTASYAMAFLVYYSQVRMFATWLRLLRTSLQLSFGALALLVAFERISTYQNHVSDVAAGVLLGLGIASFVTVFVAHLFRQVRVKRRQWPRNEQIYGYAGCYDRPTYGY
ncbi:putative phosphatidate phosphatase [Scaptodrosophila lebanonensis]|uniref:Phosphatidate phosphatase n=1 Tax=Drosophila lebanonensis TaxID=7225 RepID=A0A6J2T4K7_DROLE|nr:putative phosphatidate phosphatase [Scaptodrosophila lebanonensis]